MSTKTKSTKSSKSRTATKVAKKPSKQKTNTKAKTKTKKKKLVKAPAPVIPPFKEPYENEDGSWTYPELSDEPTSTYESEVSPRLDYYYAVNHTTGRKYVISAYDLDYYTAQAYAEAATGSEDVYIVKINSLFAWLIIRVFKVSTIEA